MTKKQEKARRAERRFVAKAKAVTLREAHEAARRQINRVDSARLLAAHDAGWVR